MTHNRHYRPNGLRRLGGIALGLGAATGGMLVAVLAQLATAPAAGADVTDIMNELDGTLGIAQTAWTNASDSFLAGNVPFGLDYAFGALDTDSLSTVGDLLYGGYQSLENVSGPYPYFGFYYIQYVVPTTLAAATADASTDLSEVQTEFAAAGAAFAGDNLATGALDAFQGIGDFAEAPEVYFIGLADALMGSL